MNESWLHPQRYRTLSCHLGADCGRTLCYFAHGDDELRRPSTGGISNKPETHDLEMALQISASATGGATRVPADGVDDISIAIANLAGLHLQQPDATVTSSIAITGGMLLP